MIYKMSKEFIEINEYDVEFWYGTDLRYNQVVKSNSSDNALLWLFMRIHKDTRYTIGVIMEKSFMLELEDYINLNLNKILISWRTLEFLN